MTEFVMVVLAIIPPDVLPSPPTPRPSAFSPRQGPGRGAYLLGGFIGLGILLLAMVLLRKRPKRIDRRTLDQ
jgi:hypothetical protein